MTIPPRLRRTLTRLRRDLLFVATGVPLHLLAAPLFLWTVTLIVKTVAGTSSSAPAVLPIPVLLVTVAGFGLTEAHRWRYRELCGVELPRLRLAVPGRQFAYNWLVAPCLGALELLVLLLLLAGTAATTVYAWIMLL